MATMEPVVMDDAAEDMRQHSTRDPRFPLGCYLPARVIHKRHLGKALFPGEFGKLISGVQQLFQNGDWLRATSVGNHVG